MYYDDIEIGATVRVGSYLMRADEMVSYARKWDPLPWHIDEAAAGKTMFGGLTASGSHTLAVRVLLMHKIPLREGLIGAAGWDEIRFHQPVRPGDELWLEVTWVAKRQSESKPDRGIISAAMKLVNQKDEVVLSQKGTIFMRLRNRQ